MDLPYGKDKLEKILREADWNGLRQFAEIQLSLRIPSEELMSEDELAAIVDIYGIDGEIDSVKIVSNCMSITDNPKVEELSTRRRLRLYATALSIINGYSPKALG